MPEEVVSTPRADNPTRPQVKGVIAARRGPAPSTGAAMTIPAKVRQFYVRNTHATVSFALNFNSDSTSEYWVIKPGDQPLLLWINDVTVINAKGIGGNSSYEAIFMG